MSKSMLIVSDKLEIYEPIWLNAVKMGFEPSVARGYDDAARIVSHTLSGILILDSEISGKPAEPFLKRLRSSVITRYLPVIAVASRDYGQEHLSLFESGADDVVELSFSVMEFFARARCVTRPRLFGASSQPISVGGVTLHPASRRVFIRQHDQDVEIKFPPMIFEILRVLSMRVGAALTRDEILCSVEGKAPTGTRSLDVQITRLRTTLRQYRAGLRIDAVRGYGYKLAPAQAA